MSYAALFRLSGLAAILSGVLSILFNLGLIASVVSPAIDHPRTIATTLLYVFALMGIYLYQFERAGTLGLVGFSATVVSLVLNIGFRLMLAVVAPILVEQFPEAAVAVGQGPYALVLSLTQVLFVVGYVMFGIATLRANQLPRGGAMLLIVGAVVSYLSVMLPINVGALIIAAGFIWLGYAAWSSEALRVARFQPAH